MRFGTEEVFNYIRENITRSDDAWYSRLYNIIRADTLSVLSGYRLHKDDKDEIIQEVQISVTVHLSKFLKESENKSVDQRNSWLGKNVKNKMIDYLRKKNRHLNEPFEVWHETGAFFDELERAQRIGECRQRLLRAIKDVCSIKTTPDKIIAFFLNKVIGATELDRRNGAPKQTVSLLSGKTLYEASEYVKTRIRTAVSFPVPDDVYIELDNKLNIDCGGVKYGCRIFDLSVRRIADSSNWIGSKLRTQVKKGTDEQWNI